MVASLRSRVQHQLERLRTRYGQQEPRDRQPGTPPPTVQSARSAMPSSRGLLAACARTDPSSAHTVDWPPDPPIRARGVRAANDGDVYPTPPGDRCPRAPGSAFIAWCTTLATYASTPRARVQQAWLLIFMPLQMPNPSRQPSLQLLPVRYTPREVVGFKCHRVTFFGVGHGGPVRIDAQHADVPSPASLTVSAPRRVR